MPKGSEELTNARKEEIIHACCSLYEHMSFKEITIKEIGQATSFTRTSIYNYFRTKEEIFLAILQREYQQWTTDLKDIYEKHETMSKDEFSQALAHSLKERENLLKLLSMNMYDMEENSRMERLVEFKNSYGESMKAVGDCLDKFFKEMKQEDKEAFIYSFFPFMYGIYPYTQVTQKQRTAMEDARIDYKYMTIYELAYKTVKKLLGN